jgi:hypothetical protein
VSGVEFGWWVFFLLGRRTAEELSNLLIAGEFVEELFGLIVWANGGTDLLGWLVQTWSTEELLA